VGLEHCFFFIEERTTWKFFNYFPPLIFIYAIPAIMSNTSVLTQTSIVYDWLSSTVLPMFLLIMLLKVNVASTVRIMGRGIFVMLFGTAGVVIGDNLVYIVWLHILLGSKNFSKFFNRFMRVDNKRIQILEMAQTEAEDQQESVRMRHFLYLLLIGFVCTWAAEILSGKLPEIKPVLTTSTWKILLITTMGLLLSLTPARRIPASHELAMALVYIFVANMGADMERPLSSHNI